MLEEKGDLSHPLPALKINNMAEERDCPKPRTPLEESLAAGLCSVLKTKKISIYDDFFELGGNSIQAIEFINKLQYSWQENISTTAIFEAPTVIGLAGYLCLNHAEKVSRIYGPEILKGYQAEFEISNLLKEFENLSEEDAQEQINQANIAGNRSEAALTQSHQYFMRLAIAEARNAIHEGQPPYAACIVKDGKVISCVHNVIWKNQDITAHAEVQAIRVACQKLHTTDLSGCIIYSTCEPCSMCLTACHWARIDQIFYGLKMEDEVRTGLSKTTIPANVMNEIGDFHLKINAGFLRSEMIDVVEYFLNSKLRNKTDYNQIAKQYEKTKNSLIRKYIESFTLLNMIGEVSGKTILDAGCGEGYYSRALKKMGAKRVIGIDSSSEMINIAKEKEFKEALGIEFRVCSLIDLEDEKFAEKFDIAVAVNVLHYAQTKLELLEMCQKIYDHLKSDGYFFAVNENTNQNIEVYYQYEKYGIHKSISQPIQEGSEVKYNMFNGREAFSIICHYYSQKVWDDTLRSAGFREISWRQMELSPEALTQCDENYWQDFLKNPPVVGFMCRK